MPDFSYPSINVGKKSNEENMQAAKAWMMQMSDDMKYYVSRLEQRIEVLEEKVAKMGEE